MYFTFLFLLISFHFLFPYTCLWTQKLASPRTQSEFPSSQTSVPSLIAQHPILVSIILNHSVYYEHNLLCAVIEPLISFYKKILHAKHIFADFILNNDQTPFLNQPTSAEMVTSAESTLHPAIVHDAKCPHITLTLIISLKNEKLFIAPPFYLSYSKATQTQYNIWTALTSSSSDA